MEQASVEPETLPWRTRLKGYRLASRIFQGKDKVTEVLSPPSKEADLQQLDAILHKPGTKRPDVVLD